MEYSAANWSDLPPEILEEIARKLRFFEDFTAFRGVCVWWRAAAAKDIFKGTKLPLLMLPENKYNDSDEREFYILSKREIRKAAVPEAKGRRCTDARFGWIAPLGGEVYLFKPFSSSPAIIPLPNFHTFPEYHEKYSCIPEVMFVKKAILTANPSDTSNFMMFVLMNCVLGFWKNGDESWTMIESESPDCEFMNIGYCRNKMYAIDYDQRLWSWDPSATDRTQLQLLLTFNFSFYSSWMPYMVESTAGELLVINRRNRFSWGFIQPVRTTCFDVAQIDVVKREWQTIDDIGKDSIFLGENATVSVAADDFRGVIKPNSIYFTDDINGHADPNKKLGGGKNMGIFNFEDESIETFEIESFCSLCPPFWVFP